MEEIWKDIENYEGLYQVSNLGRVRSLDRVVTNYRGSFIKKGEIKAQSNLSKGYKGVCLCKDGKQKTHKVHRLVAQAFLPNPNNLPQVNHKDEDKTNNRVDNLEWCDNEYNINYSWSVPIYSININTGEYKKYSSLTEAQQITGAHKTQICGVLKGYYNRAKHYLWRHYDINDYLIGVMNYNLNKRKGVA